jgi:hypothetical protein
LPREAERDTIYKDEWMMRKDMTTYEEMTLYLHGIVAYRMIQDRFESAENGIWLIAWRSCWTILIQV